MKPRTASYSIDQIAETVRGSLLNKAPLSVSGLASISSPCEGHLTFLRGTSRSAALRTLSALPEMVVLINQESLPEPKVVETLRCVLVVVPNPQRAFLECIPLFYEDEPIERSIHPTAVVDPTARIGSHVAIGPYSVVGPRVSIGDNSILHGHVTLYRDVSIGASTELHSGVVIREGCSVGSFCCLHSNTVIGGDGFGYLSDPKLGITKVPQIGIVTIGNHVEIGVGSAIDRAAVGATTIGDHTKIDNHVQIAHNVIIGSHCIICAQVGIAGSSVLGSGVVVGGGAGIADHCTVVSGVRLSGHSGAIGNIDSPGDYMGFPAIPATEYKRLQVILRRLAKKKTPSE